MTKVNIFINIMFILLTEVHTKAINFILYLFIIKNLNFFIFNIIFYYRIQMRKTL